MNWGDSVPVSNETEWTVEYRVAAAKTAATRSRTAYTPVIFIHLRVDHYSLSLIQTIPLSFNMYQGKMTE